jgi:hypothetical protein
MSDQHSANGLHKTHIPGKANLPRKGCLLHIIHTRKIVLNVYLVMLAYCSISPEDKLCIGMRKIHSFMGWKNNLIDIRVGGGVLLVPGRSQFRYQPSYSAGLDVQITIYMSRFTIRFRGQFRALLHDQIIQNERVLLASNSIVANF